MLNNQGYGKGLKIKQKHIKRKFTKSTSILKTDKVKNRVGKSDTENANKIFKNALILKQSGRSKIKYSLSLF
jgi:hypothetical protein